MTATKHASVELSNGVAVLTLDNPGKRNAISSQMAANITAICDAIDDSSDCGAVVVVGANGYFCAGAERALLQKVAENPSEDERFELLTAVYGCFTRLGSLRVPVIAAVRGGAVGAGLNLALAADVRLVARDARLSSGFRRIGLHQGGGHGYLLTALGNSEVATAMTVFGEEISGERAAALGLAWEALPDEDIEERALDMAAVTASDPELTRAMIGSLRAQRAGWPAAVLSEQARQMWSLSRIHTQRSAGTP